MFNPDTIYFFVDDHAQGSERSSASVDRIMTYDTVEDIDDINLGAASTAVPELGSLSLMAAAGLALAIRKFRR